MLIEGRLETTTRVRPRSSKGSDRSEEGCNNLGTSLQDA